MDQDRLRGVEGGRAKAPAVHLADGVGIGGELAAQDHRASLPRRALSCAPWVVLEALPHDENSGHGITTSPAGAAARRGRGDWSASRAWTALTHRAVDAAAGVPTGTASNYWGRRALLDALVDRVVDRERDRWEQLTRGSVHRVGARRTGSARQLSGDPGPDRALVLARHALPPRPPGHEDIRPAARRGGAPRQRPVQDMAAAGRVGRPDHDVHVIANLLDGPGAAPACAAGSAGGAGTI